MLPFGLRHALANGCTDILVLSNRSAEYESPAPNAFSRLVFDVLCARGNAALKRRFAERHIRASELRDIACGRKLPEPSNARIATICAADDEQVPRLLANRAALRAAATSYAKRTLRIFGGSDAHWHLPEDCVHADPTMPPGAAPAALGLSSD